MFNGSGSFRANVTEGTTLFVVVGFPFHGFMEVKTFQSFALLNPFNDKEAPSVAMLLSMLILFTNHRWWRFPRFVAVSK